MTLEIISRVCPEKVWVVFSVIKSDAGGAIGHLYYWHFPSHCLQLSRDVNK